MKRKNEYMAKTVTLGNKGEAFIRTILKWLGYNILKSTSINSDWDCVAEIDDKRETFEGKTQDRCAQYGGFSVEVGNKTLGNYLHKFPNPDFVYQGHPCVRTGLAVTKADYQVFTDGKHIAYFISTKALKKWFKYVETHEPHRIRWGGYKDRALQVQIRLEEIYTIADKVVENFAKKGKKSKIQLALEQRGLYIGV